MDDRTTINNQELEILINEVLSPNPSQTTLDIYEYVQKHRIFIQSQFGQFLKYFEDFFDEMNIVIQLLNFVPKKTWKMNKSIQYLFYPGAMKTLHRAFEDLTDGYYDEALMLVRSVYETFLRIVFLSCYPNEWVAVFYIRRNKMNFKVTGFVKDDLKLDWGYIYRLMSKVYHSKIHKNLSSLVERAQSKTLNPIIMQYSLDDEFMVIAVNNLALVLGCLFHVMISIFKDDFHSYPKLKERIMRLEKIDQILLGLIAGHPKEKFASLSEGLIKIGEIIRTADSGKDWKKVVLKG